MKRFLRFAFAFALMLTLLASTAHDTSVVQAANNNTSSGSSIAIGSGQSWSASTAGNLIVVLEGQGTGTADNSPPTDSSAGGCTWNLVGTAPTSGTSEVSMYYCPNAPSLTSITCNFTTTVSNAVCGAMEINGALTSSVLDTSQQGNGTSTVGSAGEGPSAITTTNANDIIVYGVRIGTGTATSMAAVAPYTIPTNGSNVTTRVIAMEFNIVSTTVTQTPQFVQTGGTAASFLGTVAAFKVNASGSTPVMPPAVY